MHLLHAKNARRLLATVAISATSLCLAVFYQDAAYNIAGYALVPMLLLSAAMLWRRSLAAQVAVRALWWSTALVGAALAFAWTPNISGQAAAISGLGSTLALLALGFSATVPAGESALFAPRAARATFSIALLLAGVNALVLCYFGLLFAESLVIGDDLASFSQAGLLLGLAALSGLAAAGLFSLRVWAWALANTMTLGIAAGAALGVLPIPGALAGGIALLGLVSLATQSPLLVQLARGRGLTPPARAWAFMPNLALIGLFVISACALINSADAGC